jgi:cytochrome c-type biogenesis protein CcmH/NrfG
MHGDCPVEKQQLLEAFGTALTRSGGNANLMGAYAEFAFEELDDQELAERMFREAVATNPREATYRINLVHFLIAAGELGAAASEIEKLTALNHLGSLDDIISTLRAQLAAANKQLPEAASTQLPQSASKQ